MDIRCSAAHADDPSACDGVHDAVRVVDQFGGSALGCEHHGAILLASLDSGRVYPGPGGGSAIAVHNAAQALEPFAFQR